MKRLLLALAFLTLSAPRRADAQVDAATGSSDYSANGHIIQNGFGYFLVVNSGGSPKIVFSDDGINWGNPVSIFTSGQEGGAYPQPAAFYIDKSSEVYVCAAPNTDGGTIKLARVTLDHAGAPAQSDWTTNTIDLRGTILGVNSYEPRGDGEFDMTITVDAAGNALNGWFAIAAHKDVTQTTREGLLVTKFSTATLTSVVDRGRDVNATISVADMSIAQVDTSSNVVVLYKDPGAAWNWAVFESTMSGAPDGVLAATPTGETTRNNLFSPSMVWGKNGFAQAVLVNGTGGLQHSRVSYNAVTNIVSQGGWTTIDATASRASPSIGLLGASTLTNAATAYVVFTSTTGQYISISRGNNVDTAAVWTTTLTYRNMGSGDHFPNIIGYATPPVPPRIIFSSDSATTIQFDSIFIATAPVLTSVSDGDGAPNTGGAGSGVTGSTRTLRLTGTNLVNFAAGPKIVFFDPVTSNVDSKIRSSGRNIVSAVNPFIVDFTVSVATNITAGSRRVELVNSDGQFSSLNLSTFTIDVPLASISYPTTVVFSTGVAVISGTAGADALGTGTTNQLPAGVTQSVSQVRITKVTDGNNPSQNGYVWAGPGSGWQSPVFGFSSEENQWQDATSSSPWTYTQWANDNTAQQDGTSIKIESRGKTSDGGVGKASIGVTFVIDKLPPTINITNPLSGTVSRSQQGMTLSASDPGSKITYVDMYLADTVGTSSTTADDFYWTGSSWSAVAGSVIILTTGTTGSPQMQFSPAASPVSINFVNNNPLANIKAPLEPPFGSSVSWKNGGKYRIGATARDLLNQTGTANEATFLYDITAPTVTMNSPSTLSVSSVTPTRINSLLSIGGNVTDNVIDALDPRIVYLRVSDEFQFYLSTGGPDQFLPLGAAAATNYYMPITVAAGTTTVAWTRDFSNPNLFPADGRIFKIEIYAADKGGNSVGVATAPFISGYFTFDNVAPTVGLVFPSTATSGFAFGLNSLADLSGTANDFLPGSGLSTVRYQLLDVDNSKYWCSANLAAGSTCYANPQNSFITLLVGQNAPYNVCGTTNSYQIWHASGIAANFTSVVGHNFQLSVQAQDVAGNLSALTAFTTSFFRYDSSAPISGVTYPNTTGGSPYYLAQLGNLSGTAQDQPQPFSSGIFQEIVGIQRLSDNQWWNSNGGGGGNPGWSASRLDPTVTGGNLNKTVNPNLWTFDISGIWAYTGGTLSDSYRLYLHGVDNVSQPNSTFQNLESSNTITFTFHYDVTAPSSTLSVPIGTSTFYSAQAGFILPSITGTARDLPLTGAGSGNILSKEEVEIRDETAAPQLYWNDTLSTWQTASVYNNAAGLVPFIPVSTWSFTTSANLKASLISGHFYRVRSRATDSSKDASNTVVGNVEAPANPLALANWNSSLFGISYFGYDATPPSSVVTFPADSVSVQISSVTGTIIDGPVGAGLVISGSSQVLVAVANNGPTSCAAGFPSNNFLNMTTSTVGISFNQGSPRYFPAALVNGSWNLDLSSAPFTDGSYYHIVVKSSDSVLNVETTNSVHGAASNHVCFKWTSPEPDSLVTTPNGTTPHYGTATNPLNTVVGTASNATLVQVQFRDLTLGATYWTGSAWAPGVAATAWMSVQPSPAFAPVQSWTYDTSTLTWNGNHSFSITVRSFNGAKAQATALDVKSFVIDSSAPVTAITVPAGTLLNTLTSITATATDIAPGAVNDGAFGQVYFKVKRVSDGLFFSSVTANYTTTGSSLPFTSQAGSAYSYSDASFAANSLWTDGQQYTVQFFAKDKAGNQNAVTERTFLYDVTKPTATLATPIFPASAAYYRSLTTISGTVTDPGGAGSSGLLSVTLYLKNNQTSGFFNGSAFTAPSPFALSASLAGTDWSYGAAGLDAALADGSYTVYVEARDNATNVQDPNTWLTSASSRTFTIDKSSPASGINFPNAPAYTAAGIVASGISGTAQDSPTSGFLSTTSANITLELSYLLGNTTFYWNTTNFAGSLTQVNANATPLTGGVANWTFLNPPNNGAWTAQGDQTYTVKARATDATRDADNVWRTGNTGPFFTRTFIVDVSAPVSRTVAPSSASYVNALTQITGTANADISGIGTIQLTLKDETADLYWSGTQWVSQTISTLPASFSVPTGTQTWTYDVSAIPFTGGSRYSVTSKATDDAGNPETATSNLPFFFDTQVPDAGITVPAPGAQIPVYSNNGESSRTLSALSGTAVDGGAGPSGVNQVWVAISSGAANGLWWNDTAGAFNVSQTPIYWSSSLPSGFNPWTYNKAAFAASLTDGALYTVFARARDVAGNLRGYVTNPTDAGVIKQPFLYDVSRPTAAVASPSQPYHNATLTTFSGNALDQSGGLVSGVDTVYLAVQRAGDTRWWTWGPGGGFNDTTLDASKWTAVFSTTTAFLGSVSWSTPVPSGMFADGNTYRVIAYAKDRATNDSQGTANVAGAGKNFVYQNSAPSTAIDFPANNGKYNFAALAPLSGTAADAFSGVSQVQILLKSPAFGYWNGGTTGTTADWDSNPLTQYTRWQTVTGTTNWTKVLPPLSVLDSELFTMWVRATNVAGNQSATPSNGQLDSGLNADNSAARWFYYDNTAPISSVTLPPDGAWVNNTLPVVSGTSFDPTGAGNPTGVVNLQYKVRRSDGQYYQPSGIFRGYLGFANNGVSGTNPWSKSNFRRANMFEDATEYKINSRGDIDAASNVETPFPTSTRSSWTSPPRPPRRARPTTPGPRARPAGRRPSAGRHRR